jgi:hypothetical protein
MTGQYFCFRPSPLVSTLDASDLAATTRELNV